jgi:acetyl-CoA C-acetyltransferase
MSAAGVAGGARTPFCARHGSLREVPAATLADAAARAALQVAGVKPRSVDAVVAAITWPGDPRELRPAESIRESVSLAPTAATHETGGAEGAGMEALVRGADLIELGTAETVLVVGADSASGTPYWVGRDPSGPTVRDPVAGLIAEAGARSRALEGDRAAEDALAARSHALARAAPAGGLATVAGVDRDEPVPGDRRRDALSVLKPLFDSGGTATAGSTALPADGAAAVVLRRGDDPSVIARAPDPRRALEASGRSSAELSAVELHEGTAAEALALARELELDAELVNPAGGAIGYGHPPAATGLAMCLRLRSRLPAGEQASGLLVLPGCSVVVARG